MTAGLAMFDAMRFIKPDVATICMGMAASMGSILLTGGAPGKRYALPHAKILIHQPWVSQIGGQATDVEIAARDLIATRQTVARIYEETTKKPIEQVLQGHRPGLLHDRRRKPRNTGSSTRFSKRTAQPAGAGVEAEGGSTVDDVPFRRRKGSTEVQLLREVAGASSEVDRRPGRLHLRRVYRALQRDHRGRALQERRREPAAAQHPQAERDQPHPQSVRHRSGAREEVACGRGLQPLQAHQRRRHGRRRRAPEIEYPARRSDRFGQDVSRADAREDSRRAAWRWPTRPR